MNRTPVKLLANHTTSRILHTYADWRIGATEAEKYCHKVSNSILLTFDDYGTATEVRDILGTLARYHVKAMFFLQGDWAEKYPQLVKQIRDAGHVIGNHTYSHTALPLLDDGAVEEEIVHGLESAWLRPPQGRYNKRIRRIAKQLNYRICYWTIDSRDWTGASVDMMRHTIMTEIQPGAVILFHLHGKHTRKLLKEIIPAIVSNGYTLTSHDETW